MEIFLHPEAWIALVTLTFFEVVLGIDNIIFISIVSNRLPVEIRSKTRNLGLLLAMLVRILLLLTITWVMKFKETLFTIPDTLVFQEALAISGRDLILIFGGLFLIAKSTREINHEMEGEEEAIIEGSGKANVTGIIDSNSGWANGSGYHHDYSSSPFHRYHDHFFGSNKQFY